MTDTDITEQRILLFDGVCNLCDGMVRFVIKRDTKALFRFAALQSVPGQELLRTFCLPTSDFHSFVYIKKGHCYLRSSAILQVLKELGGAWPATAVLLLIPRFIRDGVYKLIADNRYRVWGKKDSCMVPTPDLRSRFLDEQH